MRPSLALLRTTTFRLALAQAGVVLVFVVALLVYIYFATIGQLTADSDILADQEYAALERAYAEGGIRRLNQEVVERSDLESAVEYAVRIEYLRERVRTLEARLEKLGKTDESQRKRAEHDVSRLKEKLSSAEEDLEKMKTLRASLGAGGRV